MKPSLALRSVILFLISLAMLWMLTLFESFLTGVPPGMERLLSIVLLIVPSAAGITFGILSLRRREPKPWIAVAGILMNAAFAIFNLLVLSFAG